MTYAGYAGVSVAASAHAGELRDNVRSHCSKQPPFSAYCLADGLSRPGALLNRFCGFELR